LAAFSNKPIVGLDFNTGADLMYRKLICHQDTGKIPVGPLKNYKTWALSKYVPVVSVKFSNFIIFNNYNTILIDSRFLNLVPNGK
jgi:hypothetical protein